jgi:hypothetical protein
MDIVTWPTDATIKLISDAQKLEVASYDYVTRPEVIRHQVALSALGGVLSLAASGASAHHLYVSPPSTPAKVVVTALILMGISIGVAQLRNAYKIASVVRK